MHALTEVHDTLSRELEVAPLALGVDWVVHLLPSQCSASVTAFPLGKESPTAMQSVAEVHETPSSPVNVADGLGVD